MTHYFGQISANESDALWQWGDWLLVAKMNHAEQAQDFFVRVLYGRTNKRNAHLPAFGNVDEGVFHISEMEAAIDFLNKEGE
jgi:hypothetical protein